MSQELFTFTPTELAEYLTEHQNKMLKYMEVRGFIATDVKDVLESSLAVFPMRNKKTLPERLLARFFRKDSNENAYVFPIVDVSTYGEKKSPARPQEKKRAKVFSIVKNKVDTEDK